MSNGDKTIKDLEVCPNCGRYLFPRINFDVVARHYLIWLECLTCRFLTDNVYIGKVNFTIAYPGDRQNVEPPIIEITGYSKDKILSNLDCLDLGKSLEIKSQDQEHENQD